MTSYRSFLKTCFLSVLLLVFASCSQKSKLHEFAHLMPKAQLHIHFEGSILPATILKLAQKNNVEIPFKNKPEFSTAQQFFALYSKVINCLKTPQDYELVAYEFGKECARQNILYSEVIFSMGTNCKSSGLDWVVILEALNKGKARAEKEFGITWNWLFDLLPTEMNKFEPQEFVDRVIQSRNAGLGVVAMGLFEGVVTHQVAQYQKVYDQALTVNLPIVAHAGEFEGAQSIWHAIDILKSTRVDHGVRCIEDESLVQELKERQTALNICITSNVRLGVFHSYKEHPVRRLWDAGLLITINADDPSLLNIDLNKEYDHLIDDYNFSIDELERVSLNGINASFLGQKKKEAFIQKFKTAFACLRREIF